MTFGADPWLAALTIVGWLGYWLVRRSQAQERHTAELLGPRWSRGALRGVVRRRRLGLTLMLATLACLVVALGRPRWGRKMSALVSGDTDIMVVLDVSRSMRAEDVRPSRLERARWLVQDLARRLGGERIGLVVFAGDAVLVCPCTADVTAFREVLSRVDESSVSEGGTDLAHALRTALDRLPGHSATGRDVDGARGAVDRRRDDESRDRSVVLVSDGEDLTAVPGVEDVAMRARVEGVRVHCVVVGSRGGAAIPVETSQDGPHPLLDPAGRPVVSRANHALMRRLALAGGGVFLDGGRAPYVMEDLIASRFKAPRGSGVSRSSRTVPMERFQWALGLVVVLMTVEGLAGAMAGRT